MKKIAKVLLTLGVLMVAAGLWASHELVTCVLTITTPNGPVVITREVPVEAAEILDAQGWNCPELCPFPPCD